MLRPVSLEFAVRLHLQLAMLCGRLSVFGLCRDDAGSLDQQLLAEI